MPAADHRALFDLMTALARRLSALPSRLICLRISMAASVLVVGVMVLAFVLLGILVWG